MKILVLGGTRFFGRELIRYLVEVGHNVTVATRGRREIPYSESVTALKTDRSSLSNIVTGQNQTWDVVYDQLCFSSKDAQVAVEAFSGKIGKLIMTSTTAVYPNGPNMSEADFDPHKYILKMGTRNDFNYADGKRNAEAYYFQKASFPILAVRPPFIFGINDNTNRLKDLIIAVQNEQKLKMPNLNARISMIEATDIGRILAKLGELNITGGINAASLKPITVRQFLELIEHTTNKKAIFAAAGEQSFNSDFLMEHDASVNSDLLRSYGIEARPIESWLGNLINAIHKNISP
ncbi:MAG: NAD-dependent epimerase/dehydratase family protein [Dehalococcoidales bacterium]|nr:NAD-dependent epimerase/dehydratase family protein [Dehalococcoidales bacterium]